MFGCVRREDVAVLHLAGRTLKRNRSHSQVAEVCVLCVHGLHVVLRVCNIWRSSRMNVWVVCVCVCVWCGTACTDLFPSLQLQVGSCSPTKLLSVKASLVQKLTLHTHHRNAVMYTHTHRHTHTHTYIYTWTHTSMYCTFTQANSPAHTPTHTHTHSYNMISLGWLAWTSTVKTQSL